MPSELKETTEIPSVSGRYQIGVEYPRDKQERLKKFLGIINMTAGEFAAEALDNEMAARMEDMDDTLRASVLKLIA